MNNVAADTNLVNGISGLWQNVLLYVPNVALAILLLVAGWYLAKLLSRLISGLLSKMGIDKLAKTIGLAEALRKARLGKSAADIIGVLFFWLILLLFVISAVETIGLPRLSAALDEMVVYLPKMLAAIFILVLGLFIAQLLQGIVETASASMGLESGRTLGNLVYGLIVIIVLSLAIGELEIETLLLNAVVIIILTSLALAGALSLGLGTRDLSKDIVSGVYAREIVAPGEIIEFEGQQGVVEEVSTVKTSIRLEDGSLLSVPNHALIKGSFRKIS